ncbi:MAG TPA: FAD-dependent oxidoreductase [bacterium]|nr:FAD-dependent oxidoreductase [bacterium]HPN44910.1 FAD-dependent oxidoreductase [bacterium]
MEEKKNIIILGAGPAGLTLALQLLRRKQPDWNVIIVEQKSYAGGIAASFQEEGLYFDFGSHRLHPSTSPEIMRDLQELLGDDLLNRPRNGRIRLLNRFVKFPLNPVDLLLHLPLSFVLGFSGDLLLKPFHRKNQPQRSFADALMQGLGKTICTTFYFPYARKLWGLPPQEISLIQAQRRVAANSFSKIIKKVLSLLPGIKKENAGRFFYPRQGFGQICAVLAREVERLGGQFYYSTTAEDICFKQGKPDYIRLKQYKGQAVEFIDCKSDFIFSTIPVTILARLLNPALPQQILNAGQKLKYRSMILHYLVLETGQFTPFDAHYLPDDHLIISRLSETKNYYASTQPQGLTGLCSEIPCNFGDELWNMSDAAITEKVLQELKQIDLPVQCHVRKAFTKRLAFVYPIYDQNFADHLESLDKYILQISGLISLGRQGLFAHDNTHHTMEMAYRACECLDSALQWNAELWKKRREEFAGHVVED